MSERWRRKSAKIFITLIIICLMLCILSVITAHNLTAEEVVENNNLTVGETVMNGTNIDHNVHKASYPFISYPSFIINQVTSLDIFGLVYSFSTGSVPFDYSGIASHGISSSGYSTAEGPGYLNIKDGKLCIDDVNTTLSGVSYAYDYIVKKDNGVDLYIAGKYNSTIPTDEIRDQNWSGSNYNISDIVTWYNDANNDNGSILAFEYGLKNISDGRNDLNPDQVQSFFGNDTYDYIKKYPAGDTVCLYIPSDYVETVGNDYSTTLGDYSEYGNDVRSHNAQTFCVAWNNTIVPPNSSVCGQNYFDYQSAEDSSAPGGSAAHGVCPPGRTLRDASLGEGFPIPTGMTMESSAIQFGYNPSTGVYVHNNGTYPVKIVMSYEGEGVNMVLHCHFVKYTPPN